MASQNRTASWIRYPLPHWGSTTTDQGDAQQFTRNVRLGATSSIALTAFVPVALDAAVVFWRADAARGTLVSNVRRQGAVTGVQRSGVISYSGPQGDQPTPNPEPEPEPTPTVCDLISSGLIGCWELDETSSTRADHVGGFDLADINSNVGSTAGLFDRGALFTAGGNQRLFAALDLEYFNSAFTLGLSFKLNGTTSLSQVLAASGLTLNAGGYVWIVIVTPTNNVLISFGSGFTGVVTSTETISVGTWYSLLAWENGNGLSLQINAGAVQTDAGPIQSVSGGAAISLGNVLSYQNPLDGVIDEVLLWNRALTDQERATYFARYGY